MVPFTGKPINLTDDDREFAKTAEPLIRVHISPTYGWIWHASIPGVLSHSPGPEGPFYKDEIDAADAAREVYPNGVLA